MTVRVLFFSILILLAFEVNAEYIELDCKLNSAQEVMLNLPGNVLSSVGVREIKFKDGESCNQSYAYDANPKNRSVGILSVSSEDINSSENKLYWISFQSEEVFLLGGIPITAEYLGDWKYNNIEQSGGSIWLTSYSVVNRALQLDPIEQELLVDGQLCIDNPEHVYVIGVGGAGKTCNKKRILATRKEPQCIIHDSNEMTSRIKRAPIRHCKELIKYWRNNH